MCVRVCVYVFMCGKTCNIAEITCLVHVHMCVCVGGGVCVRACVCVCERERLSVEICDRRYVTGDM